MLTQIPSHPIDCHFGMDIIADNNTGMVIKKGTLNNPTDYAVSNLADGFDGPTYFAPNGKEHVTRTRVSGQPWEPLSVNVDNASYAGLYVYTNDNVQIDINLANADAAISKVAISTWSLVTSLNGYDNTTYTDVSLADGTYYYKIGANGTYYTSDNSTVASGVIASASPAFKYSITGNDNDVSEDGSSDTTSLNLYLDAAPDGNVVVDITVSDATELAIGSTQLTFTPSNYGVTQNWSVTGVDDALDDGDITSQVTISINGAGTTDTTGYASLSSKNKNITTVDDDAAPVLNSVTPSTQTNTLSWNALFPLEPHPINILVELQELLTTMPSWLILLLDTLPYQMS